MWIGLHVDSLYSMEIPIFTLNRADLDNQYVIAESVYDYSKFFESSCVCLKDNNNESTLRLFFTFHN